LASLHGTEQEPKLQVVPNLSRRRVFSRTTYDIIRARGIVSPPRARSKCQVFPRSRLRHDPIRSRSSPSPSPSPLPLPLPPVRRSMQADKSRNVITRRAEYHSRRCSCTNSPYPARVNRIRKFNRNARSHEAEAGHPSFLPRMNVYSTTLLSDISRTRVSLARIRAITLGTLGRVSTPNN